MCLPWLLGLSNNLEDQDGDNFNGSTYPGSLGNTTSKTAMSATVMSADVIKGAFTTVSWGDQQQIGS
jgi:hypothetical protein